MLKVPRHTDNCGPLSDCRNSDKEVTQAFLEEMREHDCCYLCTDFAETWVALHTGVKHG